MFRMGQALGGWAKSLRKNQQLIGQRCLASRTKRAVCILAALMAGSLCAPSALMAGVIEVEPDPAVIATQTGSISRASVIAKKSQVVEVGRSFGTALVADNEIADVVPLSDRSIYL